MFSKIKKLLSDDKLLSEHTNKFTSRAQELFDDKNQIIPDIDFFSELFGTKPDSTGYKKWKKGCPHN